MKSVHIIAVAGALLLLSLAAFFTLAVEPERALSGAGFPRITIQDIDISAEQTYKQFKAEGFKPRKDLPGYHIKIPTDWSVDPFKDKNWTFQLNAWRNIDVFLRRYERTARKTYLNEAIAIVLDWDAYQKRNPAGPMTWNDMASGLRALRLAYIVDQVSVKRISLEPVQLDALIGLADEHAKRLQKEKFIALNNHGIFQVFGLNALCAVIEVRKSCADGRAFAARMLTKIMKASYTEQGVHKENSPAYHLFATEMLLRLGPRNFISADSRLILDKAVELKHWMGLPNGKLIPIGDSDGTGARMLATPSLTTLSDGKSHAVADLTSSGYAIIRSDPKTAGSQSMLFVAGMAHSKVHKHLDDLSFVLYESDQLVFSEAGKYGYKVDDFRRYANSEAAHNTVRVLEQPVSLDDIQLVGSELSGLAVKPDHFVVDGSVERKGLFKQTRSIRYWPGKRLDIRDTLRASRVQTYVSSLHLQRQIFPRLTNDGFEAKLKNGVTVRGVVEERDCKVELFRGQKNPVLGWESVGYLKIAPSSVITAACRGQNRTINWRITFSPAG